MQNKAIETLLATQRLPNNNDPKNLADPTNTFHACRILVVGVGNVLHRDDGFGIVVVQRLSQCADLPTNVKLVEIGIGGISLVQELFDGYDVLLIVDAVERGSAPGTLHLLTMETPDLATWPYAERQDFLADMHFTTPSKALILAKALGALPPQVFMLGCQTSVIDDLGIGLTPPVEQAVDLAVERLLTEIRRFNANFCDAGNQVK